MSFKKQTFSDKSVLEFLPDKNAAILMSGNQKLRYVIWGMFVFFVSIIVWAYFAEIDQLTRGQGRVVPSLKTQYVQSYDGGIIKEIFVHEGDHVRSGDKIIRIDDSDYRNKFSGSTANIESLSAQKLRLEAESKNLPFDPKPYTDQLPNDILLFEKNLDVGKRKRLTKKIELMREKIKLKKSELNRAEIEIVHLKKSLKLVNEAVDISTKMLDHKVVSKMKYNEQLRELNRIEGELGAKQAGLPGLRSEIKSAQASIEHAVLVFQDDARQELEKVNAQIKKIKGAKNIDEDRVQRATVASPIDGDIKKMYFSTIGGVVKPGGVIAEIVPTEEHLIIDAKIDPSRIAFVYPGQRATVRFSAYDFAVYGALGGEVISISADTMMDEITKRQYYHVKIRTTKNYLSKNGKKLPIKIGMTAIVDIINGKQTVLDYILNPIIKAKRNMLSNR